MTIKPVRARKVRIRTLFILGVAVSAILTTSSGLGAFLAYRDFARAYTANRFADDVISSVYQLTALTGDYILYFSDRAEDQWARKSQALEQILGGPEIENPELEKEILKYRRHHQKINKLFARSTALHGEYPAHLKATPEEAAILSQLQTVMQIMVSEAARNSRHFQILMVDAEKRMALFGGTFGSLMILLLLLLWLAVAIRIIRPIQILRDGILQFGRGDLQFRFSPKAHDEIGDVAAAFDHMADDLGKTMASRDELNREIAERERMEEQLLRSQKMEAVGQLTGGIAHDFNNLLAAMRGSAELLEMKVRDTPDASRDFTRLISSIDRAGSLTQRLLAFSRKQSLSPSATHVGELLQELEDMLQRTLGETVDLRIKFADHLWLAMVDGHQLDHVVINLAINARDAMPEGGALTIEAVNATINATDIDGQEDVTPGDYVEIAVTDTGHGMTPDVIKKAFEPFFTTKDVGKGSGLGLSMVYGFAKQSDGYVTVSSKVDCGTAIKLFLPRFKGVMAKEETRPNLVQVTSGSERILIVEDEADVREIPVAVLEMQGYEVIQAGNGREAIERLEKEPSIDLLFTDVVLPGGLSGVDVAREAYQLHPNIKVLYTSGYSDNHFPPDTVEHLISKPYGLAELSDRIRALFDADTR